MRSHIIINATMLNTEAMTGLGVYTVNLLRELLPLLSSDEEVREILILGDRQRIRKFLGDLLKNPKNTVGHLSTTNPINRLILLNRAIKRVPDRGSTAFYSPTHHGVVLGRVAQVITIHDLFARLFPENYRFQYYYFKWYMPRLLRRTQAVITDSESTSRDIEKFYGTGMGVTSVHAALPNNLTRVTSEPVAGLADQNYFLFVGPSYSYKNCDRLIDAFVQYREFPGTNDFKLVFVGGRESYKEFLREYVAKHALPVVDDILFLGHVSDEQLAWLYGQAAAAMVTSLCEGFGLPALEAMYFGCPVVASNTGSLPEVCGEAALFVDPYSVADMGGAMRRITEEKELRNGLVKKGRDNLGRFGWKLAAEKVYGILDGL